MVKKFHPSAANGDDSSTEITLNNVKSSGGVGDLEQQSLEAEVSGKSVDHERPFCSFGLVVIFASFLSCFVVGVTYISFSVFYMYLVEHFDSNKATTGWIGSLFLAVGNILGIIFSVFIKFYGCRVVAVAGGFTWFVGFALSAVAPDIYFLYFSYGLIAGMGFNMVTLSSFVIVQQYFQKHRALAAGMSAAGISVGTLSGGPIIGALIGVLGWRGAMLIQAGIAANCMVLGSFYRPVRNNQKRDPVKESRSALAKENADKSGLKEPKQDRLGAILAQLFKDMMNLALFKNLPFALCFTGTFFMNIGLVIFYQHTPSRAVSLGISKERAALLPAAIGVATLLARIIGSVVGNLRRVNRTLQYGVCFTLGGIMLIVNTSTTTFTTIALVGAVIGFLGGCALTVQTTVLSDLVGVENIARAQAFVLLATGFGALIAVPLAGFIYDRTANYSIPFYTGGSVEIFGGILVIIAAVVHLRKSKESK